MTFSITSALGAGSGVDIQALAQGLVDAVRQPRQALIEKTIERSEARISGYGAIKFALADLKAAFSKLNDKSEFPALKAINSQPNAFSVTLGPNATLGASHSIEVLQLARVQTSATEKYATTGTSLNNGSAFNLELRVGVDPATATPQTIAVNTPTPQGMVNAINAANLGVTAAIVNTGDPALPFQVVVTGGSGAAKTFTLTQVQGNKVQFNTTQTALDSSVRADGVVVNRATNTLTDVVPNMTLTLHSLTTGGPARVTTDRDTAALTENIKALVTAYNDFQDAMNVLRDPGSDVEGFGGALAGDSLVRSLSLQVRGLMEKLSSSPGTNIRAARDVGLSMDRTGKLVLDEAKLSTALKTRFDEVATMFSANAENQSVFSPAPGGLAGDAVKSIDAMLRSTGAVETQVRGSEEQIKRAERDLAELDERMARLLERYTRQFAAMESIVNSSKALQTGLKGTFEGLMATYTKR